MKKIVFLVLSMAGAVCLQAQTDVDSSVVKNHYFDGIKQFTNQAEFVKPDFEKHDSVKHVRVDSVKHPIFKKDLDSAKLLAMKDSLPVIKRCVHKDSLRKIAVDSAKAFHKRDSSKFVEFDSLKIAKHDSLRAKKPARIHDSLRVNDSTIVLVGKKPVFGNKDRHHFDSTFALRPIDSVAKDSSVITRKSHKETTHLYPNPARGSVTVQADSTVAKIEILNATTGTVVYQNQNDNSFDLSELPSGVYIIKILIGEELITKTITKP